MAYINFKEENYKLKIQLEKRKKNNEKNYNYIIKHKNEMTDYSPDNRYSYEKIEGEFIGKKGTLDDPNGIMSCYITDDGKKIGHHGAGDYYISIRHTSEIDQLIPIIRQSLSINKK